MQLKLKDETILECIEFHPGINGASEVMFILEGDYLIIKPLLTKENLSYFEKIRDDGESEIFNGYDKITNLSSISNVENEAKSTIIVSVQLTTVIDALTTLQKENSEMKEQMKTLLVLVGKMNITSE